MTFIPPQRDVEHWQHRALCREVGADIFHPEKGGSTRPAKSICARCPVTAQCLQWALDNGERFGIYGGMSERERRPLHTRRGAA